LTGAGRTATGRAAAGCTAASRDSRLRDRLNSDHPYGVLLAIRLVPPDLMAEFRREADGLGERPASHAGAAMVVALWLLSTAALL
jgi:hypothetical protein